MTLPPHWTERNANPETRGTGIVTIYRNGMPWEQRTVKVKDAEQLKTHRTRKRTKPVLSRQTGRPAATTAGEFAGILIADLVAEYFIDRTKKRR